MPPKLNAEAAAAAAARAEEALAAELAAQQAAAQAAAVQADALAAQLPDDLPRAGVCKLPPFWQPDPELWFVRIESAFRRCHITSSVVKFDYTLEKLPDSALSSIKNLVRSVNAHTPDPYNLLKEKILTSFQPTKWSLINRLLDHPELGDRRPSALLDDMLALLPPKEQPGDLFLGMFLRRLPADMRDQLGSQEFASPEAMAALADRIWDSRGPSEHTAAVMPASSSGQSRRSGNHRQNRSPRRSQSPVNATGRSATPGPDRLCFYHGRFGVKALKCEPPCSWAGNGRAAGSGN